MHYIDDNGVAVLVGAIIRLAAEDYHQGRRVHQGEGDPAQFLSEANMLHLVPRIVEAPVIRSLGLINGRRPSNPNGPYGRAWGDPR